METKTKKHKNPPNSSISFINICGLNKNLNSVHHYLQSCKPLILFLTETQISHKTSTKHLQCPGYELISSFRLHGGVCAYVRSTLACTRLPALEKGKPDILWLKLALKSTTKFICCIYRSPSDNSFNELFDSISSQIDELVSGFPSAEVIVLGDFNVHNREWLRSSKTDAQGRAAEIFAISNSLTNLVNEPTFFPRDHSREKNPLDLFLTTHPEPYSLSVCAPLGNSDHGLVTASCPIQLETVERLPPRTIWHYNSADWEGLRDFFSAFPWNTVCFSSSDPSEICSHVTEVIQIGIESFIPQSQITSKSHNQKPWFSKNCDNARLKKINTHKRLLQDPTPENRQAFVEARNQYNQIISESKSSFNKRIKDKVLSCPNGSKSFWSLAKNISKNFCQSTFPPLISDNEIVSTSKGKADLFAKQFAANSTLITPAHFSVPTIDPVPYHMADIKFKVKQVQKLLLSLDTNKSSGQDGIHAIVLKKCAPELAPILTRLFRTSYNMGIFPENWKTARVQPVPKKGSKSIPSNYRPISILSVICKVMEKVINSRILKYLERHKLIHDRQYGFRQQRSTADLLTLVTHSWYKSLELHGESQIVSLDISKAFDKVWHAALLNKLPSYGLPVKLCTWIGSFLSGRRISVVVDGHSSDLYSINAGVPQGSVLAPTLFLLHINDLLGSCKNPIHSYADDSTLHSSISFSKPVSEGELDDKRRTLRISISQDLQSILDWGARNLVQFNASKTQPCLLSRKKSGNSHPIHMNGLILQEKDSFDLVGVSFDHDLNWHRHISTIASSAAKKLGFLFRAKKYFSSSNLYTLYVSQIRPCLEYCSNIWGAAPPTTLGILDAIERKAVRLINDPTLTNKLPCLAHRRAVGDLSLYYRYFHGFCSQELASIIPPLAIPNRTTRLTSHMHPYTVQLQKHRTDYFSRSFIPRVSRLWNALPSNVFPSPPNLQTFKSRINKLNLLSLLTPTVH